MNNKGQTLVLFVVLIPLILMLFAFVFDSAYISRKDTELEGIATSSLKSVMENKDYSLEEKNIYLLMTEKFLNRLSLMNWHIITKFYNTDGFSQINLAIRHLLQVYMEKSRVAEYISILIHYSSTSLAHSIPVSRHNDKSAFNPECGLNKILTLL